MNPAPLQAPLRLSTAQFAGRSQACKGVRSALNLS